MTLQLNARLKLGENGDNDANTHLCQAWYSCCCAHVLAPACVVAAACICSECCWTSSAAASAPASLSAAGTREMLSTELVFAPCPSFSCSGLRKTVSSPAAAAAVQELVSNMSKLDVARQSPLHERSASPRLCYTREPGSLSAPYESPHRMSSSDDHEKQASTASTVRQHDAALSRATGLSHAQTAAEAPLSSASAKAGGAVVGEHALLFFQKQVTDALLAADMLC